MPVVGHIGWPGEQVEYDATMNGEESGQGAAALDCVACRCDALQLVHWVGRKTKTARETQGQGL